MIQWVLFFTLSLNLFALEISIDSAKDDFQNYSILHLKNDSKFQCSDTKDDFEVVTEIVCEFDQKASKHIAQLQNNFFKITNSIKNKKLYITIKPFHKIKLMPNIFNFIVDDDVYNPNVKSSNEWIVIGYIKKLPLVSSKKSQAGINLPFTMKKDKFPFVGGLDIKGNPIHIKKVQDVTDYLKIKNLYLEKKYDSCLELIESVLNEYPNSLFKAELLFYKIRVYSKLNDYDNIIELSKVYLSNYASDENVPEVLALTANAYAKIGLNIDADYFFDRLFSEHQESLYTEWGYIYKGDMFEASGGASKAVAFYKKALMETQNIDVAVTAAYKLALYYIGEIKTKEASQYVQKIADKQPKYFMKDLKKSMDMMYAFADEGDYYTASVIAKAILDSSDKKSDEYESILKDRGIWLSKTSRKKEALKALNKYLKEFNDGDYEEEVQVTKDALFFDTAESNDSVKLKHYNELITQYSNDSIGNRALYEKSKLLLKKGMYGDLLGIKEQLLELDKDKYKDTDKMVIDAATGSMKLYLKHDECQEVLNISNEYNITLSDKWDDGVYTCSMKGADYRLAKKIATKNLKSKNIEERKKWLFRYIKIDFATGNYSEVIEASKELISLIEDELDKNSQYKDIYRYQFDAYKRLEDSTNMLKSIVKVEKVFGIESKDIERYVAVLAVGNRLKDSNIVIKYAKYVMQIQKETSTYVESPYVEFTLSQVYIEKELYNKALKVLKSLEKVKLTNKERSRAKYMLGSVYTKLWRDSEAKKAYKASIDADATTPWAKLAKSALEI